jgi:hypothetical protein
VSLSDAGGLFGVLLILAAYAGAQLGRLEPRCAPALILNLAGAGLILWSLRFSFNLSAFLMEAAWALVALYGLIRLLIRNRSRRPPSAADRPASPSGR